MALFTEIEERNDHSRNNHGEVKRVVRLMEERFGRTTRIATRTFVLDRYSLRIKKIVGSDGGYKASGEFARFGQVGDVFNRPRTRTVTRVVHTNDSDGAVLAGAAVGVLLGTIFSK